MRLVTTRLVLREFTRSDWASLLAIRSDPRFGRFYPPHECSESGVRDRVDEFITWQEEEPRRNYQWAVVARETGELLGTCGLRRRLREAPAADIGFEVDPRQWGRGYATELAQRLLLFGFDGLGLHRIEAHCVADNVASARVLEKIGMSREGRLRDKEWFADRWWDVLLYAILEAEWHAQAAPAPVPVLQP